MEMWLQIERQHLLLVMLCVSCQRSTLQSLECSRCGPYPSLSSHRMNLHTCQLHFAAWCSSFTIFHRTLVKSNVSFLSVLLPLSCVSGTEEEHEAATKIQGRWLAKKGPSALKKSGEPQGILTCIECGNLCIPPAHQTVCFHARSTPLFWPNRVRAF